LSHFYNKSDFDVKNVTGQFILASNIKHIPINWTKYEKDNWILGVNKLPVLDIKNGLGKTIGWCLGYPVYPDNSNSGHICINNQNEDFIDLRAVDHFYENTGGRFVIILLTKNDKKIYLDSYGSLSAVYSLSEPIVASTNTLINCDKEWDFDLIKSLNMPESGLWYPSGLTPQKNIRRLMPNHCLDLDNWVVTRHWPTLVSELSMNNDIEMNISKITSCIKNTISCVADNYPIQLCLTAGKDTRMILACSRKYLDNIIFFTFTSNKENIDTNIAGILAKKLNLKHHFISVQTASDEEMCNWLYLTGHAVSGDIWKVHKSLESLDRTRVLLPGMAGAVGRAVYWQQSDHINKKITAKQLLTRAHFTNQKYILEATENWLAELDGFNIFNILDLFFIEQRTGCWAAPQHYGNTISKFEFSVFNHRVIFRSMLQVPYEYRRQKNLEGDICRNMWPELLELPFNEYTGFRGLIGKLKNTLKNLIKKYILKY